MLLIFLQVLTLFIFISIGFTLSKMKLVKEEHSKILSNLLVYVFLPCNIIKSLSTNFTVEYIGNNYKLIIVCFICVVALLVLSHFMTGLFTKDKYEKDVYEYSTLVSNYGYMGYALSEALLGPKGLVSLITFSIPISIYIYTVGYAKLSKNKLNFKSLLNPVTISMVIGIILGLSGLQIPAYIVDLLTKSAGCLSPISMILTGIAMSTLPIKKLLCEKKYYFLSIFRIVILPITIGLILTLLSMDDVAKIAVLLYALPMGLNPIIFARLVDENYEVGAGLTLVSSIMSLITVPLIFTLFKIGI